MRKNTARHWLHAGLDLLPLILIPVFMIYSHRHTIDSGSIQVPQNQVVDFNQQLDFHNDSFTRVGLDFDIGKNFITLNGVSNDRDFISISRDNVSPIIQGHKYFLGFPTGSVNTYGIGILASGVYENSDNFSTNIFTATQTSDYSFMFVVRASNVSFNNVNIDFLFTDLTQMFGAGNEPSVSEFLSLYPVGNYSYTLSQKELLKNYTTITYNDTDIMSQATYQLYNAVDKYFNMGNVFNMGAVYDWFNLNIFSGNAPIAVYIVWQIVLYEFVMDLLFLLYALFMWFIDVTKRLIEKPLDSIK